MAPIRPALKSKRIASTTAIKQSTTYPAKSTGSAFNSSKRDKQLIKQSIFRAKVQDAGVKKQKRRRPSKKLVANLDSLEDALHDITAGREDRKSNLKTIKGGRGEAKRREKVLNEERERFGKNLAILSQAGKDQSTTDEDSNNRWTALRAHIQASMDQKSKQSG